MEWSEGKVECLDLHKPSVVGQISDISSVDSPVAGEWDVRRSLPIRSPSATAAEPRQG